MFNLAQFKIQTLYKHKESCFFKYTFSENLVLKKINLYVLLVGKKNTCIHVDHYGTRYPLRRGQKYDQK